LWFLSSQWYYLVSTLSGLRFGDPPPFDSDAYIALCRSHLSPEQFEALATVSLVPGRHEPCCAAEASWQQWETFVRNVLISVRAQRLNMSADKWLRPEKDVFPGIRRRVEEACDQSDPAARERAIDRLRWAFLDGLTVGSEFKFDALVVYRLRLLLTEKWAPREPTRAAQSVAAETERLTEQAGIERRTVETEE